MKKLLFLICSIASAQFTSGATPTLVSFIAAFGTCASVGTSPAVIMWNGSKFVCATLGTGVAFNSTTNQISATAVPSTPHWTTDTFSFASVAVGSTTASFTLSKVPIAGVILYYYSSANLFTSAWGSVQYTGQPVTVTLPVGWLLTDGIAFIYADQ